MISPSLKEIKNIYLQLGVGERNTVTNSECWIIYPTSVPILKTPGICREKCNNSSNNLYL